MPQLTVYNIIHSEKAKTIEQASSIIQHLRSSQGNQENLELNFSGISWITSMFADRLVRALASFYGADFEKRINVTGVEPTNVMFTSLWESAIAKFRFPHDSMAEA